MSSGTAKQNLRCEKGSRDSRCVAPPLPVGHGHAHSVAGKPESRASFPSFPSVKTLFCFPLSAFRFPLFCFLLSALCFSACSPLHLSAVDPALAIYRGPQPSTQAAWSHLHSLGISNVIKLNAESEAGDSPAGSLQMHVYRDPISLAQQLLAVPTATVQAALAQITPGTYIHCQHGQDRTGLIVACYRVTHDHWSRPAAEKEMIEYGFHPSLHGLYEYWERFTPAPSMTNFQSSIFNAQ